MLKLTDALPGIMNICPERMQLSTQSFKQLRFSDRLGTQMISDELFPRLRLGAHADEGGEFGVVEGQEFFEGVDGGIVEMQCVV